MADLNYTIDPVTNSVTFQVDDIEVVIPPTDKTLSVEGQAADGKKTGDELALKVSKSDIVNNLTSTAANRPLSAAQGKALSDTKADKGNLNFSETASVASLAALQTAILDKIDDGSGTRLLNLSTFLSSSFDPFETNGGYGIHVYVRSNSYFSVLMHGYGNNSVVKGSYKNGSWDWQKLVTKNDLNGTSIDITNDVVTRTGATGTCNCFVSKVGGMNLITLNIRIGASYTPNVQAGQDNIIAVLPAEYRPIRKNYMTTCDQAGTYYIVSVESNGNFGIYPVNTPNSFLRLSFPIY